MPAGEDNRTRSAGFAYDAERQSIRQTGEQTRTRSIYPAVLQSAATISAPLTPAGSPSELRMPTLRLTD